MVTGFIGLDCGHLVRRSRLGTFKRIKFRLGFDQQRSINFNEKETNRREF